MVNIFYLYILYLHTHITLTEQYLLYMFTYSESIKLMLIVLHSILSHNELDVTCDNGTKETSKKKKSCTRNKIRECFESFT